MVVGEIVVTGEGVTSVLHDLYDVGIGEFAASKTLQRAHVPFFQVSAPFHLLEVGCCTIWKLCIIGVYPLDLYLAIGSDPYVLCRVAKKHQVRVALPFDLVIAVAFEFVHDAHFEFQCRCLFGVQAHLQVDFLHVTRHQRGYLRIRVGVHAAFLLDTGECFLQHQPQLKPCLHLFAPVHRQRVNGLYHRVVVLRDLCHHPVDHLEGVVVDGKAHIGHPRIGTVRVASTFHPHDAHLVADGLLALVVGKVDVVLVVRMAEVVARTPYTVVMDRKRDLQPVILALLHGNRHVLVWECAACFSYFHVVIPLYVSS